MLRGLAVFLAAIMLLTGPKATAQTQAPPAAPPAPTWSAMFQGDPGGWPSPDAACEAQRLHFNPNATPQPTEYSGGLFASCHWGINQNSNTILPALARAGCAQPWVWADPGICQRGGGELEARAQCDCEAAPISGAPDPRVGNPIALNYGAKSDLETDYATEDGRFAVVREYYSFGEDYTNVKSPTSIPGFGGRWHGVTPGRLAAWGDRGEKIEYLNTNGGFSLFRSRDYYEDADWTWIAPAATRYRLSVVTTPTVTHKDFFVNGASVANGPAEMRLDKPRGEYILFRRAGTSAWPRYLVPVERGYPDGYRIFYSYPDTGEYPSTVSDSLGRTMTLTWIDAERLSFAGLLPSRPVKVISEIALPDSTKLQYGYGVGTDARGAQTKDRLESVKRVSATGTTLWARTYLYENTNFTYALTGKVDQNGNRLSTYAYDQAGLASSTELAGGVNKYTVTNLEDPGQINLIRQVTNPLGHRTDYLFHKWHYYANEQMVLTSTTEHAGNGVESASTTYQYSGYVGDRGISNFTDEKGRTLHLDTDGLLRPTQIREASGTPEARTTKITWHPVFDLPTREERPGLNIDYVYSSTGLLQSKTETDTTTQTVPYSTAGQTRTWVYEWNGNGRLLSLNGPKGLDVNGKDDVTTFTYDPGGNLLTSTNALGHVTQFANYDVNGRPRTMTDLNGIDTLYAYDPLGRVASITSKSPAGPADDRITTFDYDFEGRVTGITAPGTQKLFFDYDLAGQITAIRGAGGEKMAFTRDPMGNVTVESVKRADGSTARETSRTFDGLGRLLTETLGPGRTTSLAYDKLGNVTSITSPQSAATVRAFDSLNRLVSSVAPDTGDSRTVYNVFDQATSFTDPIAVQTTFVRNGFGEVIREVSPDRGTSTYHYDAAGEVIASIDGRGQRIDIVRDALGRILTKTPIGRPATEVVTYDYDADMFGGGSYAKGRLTAMLDGSGTTQFKYDFHGNVLVKRMKTGALAPADLAWAYDAADRIQSITYPSGRIVNYQRDALGRVISVSTKADASAAAVTLASGITYEPFGSMLTATYGNGTALAQSWGNDGRLASRRLHPVAGGADLSSLTYGYDNDDNIVSIVDNVDPARTLAYDYDAVDRLRKVVASTGSLKRQDIVYDLNGNRTRVEHRAEPPDPTPASTATYTRTPGTNRPASITDPGGTRTIAYDTRGNTIGESRPGGAITVAYDGYARLTSYAASGELPLLNGYNGLDERVSAGTAIDMRHYVYDNDGRLMGEYGASAVDVKAETIWLSPEVGLPDQPVGGDDGVRGYAPLALATGGALYWVHGSHLGVPIVITDAAGAPASPGGYSRVGFPGQMRTLPDLYYNRYRDYDPTTGQYIQADPIGLEGGSNPYGYADNNPITRIDPLGLQTAPSVSQVANVAIDWWWKRQLTPRRATPWGRAIGIGEAIGAAAAATKFLVERHCERLKRDHEECDLEREQERRYCRRFSPIIAAVARCYRRADDNYVLCRRGFPGQPWWTDADEDGVRIPTRATKKRRR